MGKQKTQSKRRSQTQVRARTGWRGWLLGTVLGTIVVGLLINLLSSMLPNALGHVSHWWQARKTTDRPAGGKPTPTLSPVSAFYALVMNKTDASFHIDIFKAGKWWHDHHLPAGVQVAVGSPEPEMGIRICHEERGYPWLTDHWTIAAWPKEGPLVPDYEFYYGTGDRIFLRTGANAYGEVQPAQDARPDASPPTSGYKRLPFRAHSPP